MPRPNDECSLSSEIWTKIHAVPVIFSQKATLSWQFYDKIYITIVF